MRRGQLGSANDIAYTRFRRQRKDSTVAVRKVLGASFGRVAAARTSTASRKFQHGNLNSHERNKSAFIQFGSMQYAHQLDAKPLMVSTLKKAFGFSLDAMVHVRFLGLSEVAGNWRKRGASCPVFSNGRISNRHLKGATRYNLILQDTRESLVSQLSKKDKTKIARQFAEIDTDGDGCITVDEAAAYFTRRAKLRAEMYAKKYAKQSTLFIKKITELQRMTNCFIRSFRDQDTDRSGKIEYDEYLLTEAYNIYLERQMGDGNAEGGSTTDDGELSRLNSTRSETGAEDSAPQSDKPAGRNEQKRGGRDIVMESPLFPQSHRTVPASSVDTTSSRSGARGNGDAKPSGPWNARGWRASRDLD